MSPKFLSKHVSEVLSEVSQSKSSGDFTSAEFLELSTFFWCKKIALPTDVTNYILKIQQDFFPEVIQDFEKNWDGSNSLFPFQTNSSMRRYFVTRFMRKVDRNEDYLTAITFLALAFVGIGYVFYLLQSSSGDNQPPSLVPEPTLLLLVIRPQEEAMLSALNMQKRITPDACKPLYRATQAIWMGTAREFQQSGLERWFSKEHAVSPLEQSEYDVFFMKIEIGRSDAGFESGASQIERHDAFQKLPELAKSILVSPRLPSKAYGNSLLYSR